MTERERILIDNFSRGMLQNGEAAIYISCQKLRSFLRAKGEELKFEEAFILWRGWVGEPLFSILANDRKIIALLGEERFNLFYEALELLEENNFVFSQDKVYTIVEKAHLRKMLQNSNRVSVA